MKKQIEGPKTGIFKYMLSSKARSKLLLYYLTTTLSTVDPNITAASVNMYGQHLADIQGRAAQEALSQYREQEEINEKIAYSQQVSENMEEFSQLLYNCQKVVSDRIFFGNKESLLEIMKQDYKLQSLDYHNIYVWLDFLFNKYIIYIDPEQNFDTKEQYDGLSYYIFDINKGPDFFDGSPAENDFHPGKGVSFNMMRQIEELGNELAWLVDMTCHLEKPINSYATIWDFDEYGKYYSRKPENLYIVFKPSFKGECIFSGKKSFKIKKNNGEIFYGVNAFLPQRMDRNNVLDVVYLDDFHNKDDRTQAYKLRDTELNKQLCYLLNQFSQVKTQEDLINATLFLATLESAIESDSFRYYINNEAEKIPDTGKNTIVLSKDNINTSSKNNRSIYTENLVSKTNREYFTRNLRLKLPQGDQSSVQQRPINRIPFPEKGKGYNRSGSNR